MAYVMVWLVAVLTVNLCVELVRKLGLGWDSHAYWLAWRGPMYDAAPNTVDAFLYTPAFAQLFWPLAQLPWPVACAVTVALPAFALAYLLRPLGVSWALPLWLIGLAETLSGQHLLADGPVRLVGTQPSLALGGARPDEGHPRARIPCGSWPAGSGAISVPAWQPPWPWWQCRSSSPPPSGRSGSNS